MPQPLCTGTLLKCSMGIAPSAYVVLPKPGSPMILGALPTGTIIDNVPMVNVLPFGMCQSMANPTVASATAAAMGALTPMPCLPVIVSPWVPPAVSTLSNMMPAATASSVCMCAYGGVISVATPIPGPAQAT